MESLLMWAVSRPSHASNLPNGRGHTTFIGNKLKYGRLDAGTDGRGYSDGMFGLSQRKDIETAGKIFQRYQVLGVGGLVEVY